MPCSSEAASFLPERSTRYLVMLVGMLMSATIFEGYDITIFHLCTPDIAHTFALGNASIGLMAAVVRFGGLLSFFVVTLADHFGRKPVISCTVLCYAVFTLLTALSRGMASFTFFQSCSQVFLAAEFGVAMTMITEEFPERARGRGIAVLHMTAFFGVATAGLLYGYVAPSRWGWRGMYLLGIAPLLLVALLRRGMRETARFEQLRAVGEVGTIGAGVFSHLRKSIAPLSGPYRRRVLVLALLCNSLGLVGGPTISFFSLYAKRDHQWSSGQIGFAVVLAYLVATTGTLSCGFLMDRLGRRPAAILFCVGAGIAMALLFQSSAHNSMMVALAATMFSYQGARTAASALSAELFPTKARAGGYCLCVQVLGQLGWTFAPLAVGLLSIPMHGLGNAASLFGVGPVLGALLVLLWVPETAGKRLEELAL
ncbi:MAG TPA: MFS transporter [Candidatus Binataceae bacterium]|nr:MFS transporter [Candidatus Binataceae bacterium]